MTNNRRLFFIWAVKSLPIIVEQLTKAGRDITTPAALIRKGTQPDQQVFKGTLENLESLVIEHNVKPPTLIMIGDVVNTFEPKQLTGLGYLTP